MLTKGAGNFPVLFGFAGAYDAIPSIAAAYGMRRLRAAYTGNLLRIRRSSDNAESDIGSTGAGDLDTATVATFIGGGSGYIVKWYNQSGNGYDATQTTAAYQPLYVASGQNSRPVLRFDGVDDRLRATVLSAATNPTVISVICKNSWNATNRKWLAWDDSDAYLSWIGSGNTGASVQDFGTGAGLISESLGAINTNYNVIAMSYDGALYQYYRNAQKISLGLNAASTFASMDLSLGCRSWADSGFADVDIAELIICNAALSDANRQAAEAAANTYWAVY